MKLATVFKGWRSREQCKLLYQNAALGFMQKLQP